MRARNIKPGFFENEFIAELPPQTRLLFIGLWLMADREGRMEDRPKRFKMKLFPADSWEIEPMLIELAEVGLIVRYQIDDAKYITIPKFFKHQRPHPNEKASVIPEPTEESITKVVSASDQGSKHLALNDDVLNTDIRNPESTAVAPRPSEPPEFEEFKSLFPKRAGSQPWSNALKAIRARLREGNSWTEILSGVKRYAEFIRATGKEGTEFVLQAATFCGPTKRFLEDWTPPKPENGATDSYFDDLRRATNADH